MSGELLPSLPPPWFPHRSSRQRRKPPSAWFEFFTTQIENDHTRKAYFHATRRFADWCEARGIR